MYGSLHVYPVGDRFNPNPPPAASLGFSALAHRLVRLAHGRAGWHRRAHLAHPDHRRGEGRRKQHSNRIAPTPDTKGGKWIDKNVTYWKHTKFIHKLISIYTILSIM